MPKYYSLLYIDCDSSKSCYVIDIIKTNNDIDIYDYLTKKYLKYKKTSKAGNFGILCDRLDTIVDYMKYDDKDIEYDDVYDWIKNDCNQDDFDSIIVSENKPIIIK